MDITLVKETSVMVAVSVEQRHHLWNVNPVVVFANLDLLLWTFYHSLKFRNIFLVSNTKLFSVFCLKGEIAIAAVESLLWPDYFVSIYNQAQSLVAKTAGKYVVINKPGLGHN